MERAKSEIERAITAILKDNAPEERRSDVAGVIGVLGDKFRQLDTGNWSEEYQTAGFLGKEKNRDDAQEFICGFIWCMSCAGLITGDKRQEFTDQLNKLRFRKSGAAAGQESEGGGNE